MPTPCAIDAFIRAIVVYFIKESPHGLYPILVELRKAILEARRLGSICLPRFHAKVEAISHFSGAGDDAANQRGLA